MALTVASRRGGRVAGGRCSLGSLFLAQGAPLFDHVAPEAGAIAFVRYYHDINSTTLVQRLREEQSVLVVPGDHFHMDRHLRIGFGSHPEHLVGALERIASLMDRIPAHAR